MWSYDGQAIATPTFRLGIGRRGTRLDGHRPGPLLSVPVRRGDAGSSGRRPSGRCSCRSSASGREDRLRARFRPSTSEGNAGSATAGRSTASPPSQVPCPTRSSGWSCSRPDCANGTSEHIADVALRLMLAVRQDKPLPTFERTRVPPRPGPAARGPLRAGEAVRRRPAGQALAAGRTGSGWRRARWRKLVVDDCLIVRPHASRNAITWTWGGMPFRGRSQAGPGPERFAGLIGEYGWDHNVLYILEKDGKLHALIEWFFDYPLKEEGPDRFRFPDVGLYDGEALVFTPRRRRAGRRRSRRRAWSSPAAGSTARTARRSGSRRVRPVAELRAEHRGRSGRRRDRRFRKPDLVDLATLDPTIKLDIRYATDNNFLGTPLYTSARAFLQRPAAEALLRAHRALEPQGYGLLIHDAYRPWHVTKLFWDATPESGHAFVADPAKGSKHNRGAAVDLTLYDRSDRPAGRDGRRLRRVLAPLIPRLPRRHLTRALAPRPAAPSHGGPGLHRQRGRMVALRLQDWAKYPILNRRFEELK